MEQWIWDEEIKLTDLIKLGIAPLHCKLRAMEFLFGVGVKIRALKDQRPISKEEQLRLAKIELQKEFIEQLGIRIDFIKQGKGTSTNGNSATRLFENPEISAKILDIDVDILNGFSKQLARINSTTTLHDPDEYYQDSRQLFDNFVKHLGHVANMSPTVHRMIVHGHIFLKWAKEVNLPLGKLRETYHYLIKTLVNDS